MGDGRNNRERVRSGPCAPLTDGFGSALHGLNTACWPNWQGKVLRIQQCKFESCTCLLIYFKFNKFSSAGTPSEGRRSSVMMSLEAQFYKPIKQASK